MILSNTPRRLTWLAICLCALAGTPLPVSAQPDDDPDEPPVVGQPAGFNGAVGVYKVATTAEPTDLQAEDPLTLTVRITGSGSPRHPPQRPPLRRLPEFTRRFVIEDLPGPSPTASPAVWEFRYRLKPLNPTVKEIPALRFDYFKPGVIPREKGYRSTYAPAIPLTVRPRAQVQPADIQGAAPVAHPEALYELAEDPAAVLGHAEPFALPAGWLVALMLLLPPVLCAGWYAGWRLRYPDTVRLARRRQSRAARQALQALEGIRPDHPGSLAWQVGAVVADYLRQRWDLAAVEPTPAEVADHLKQLGCAGSLADQAAAFFRACDTARFAPDHAAGPEDWKAAAAQLITALEDQPCPAQPS
jgi:hypothetical protein